MRTAITHPAMDVLTYAASLRMGTPSYPGIDTYVVCQKLLEAGMPVEDIVKKLTRIAVHGDDGSFENSWKNATNGLDLTGFLNGELGISGGLDFTVPDRVNSVIAMLAGLPQPSHYAYNFMEEVTPIHIPTKVGNDNPENVNHPNPAGYRLSATGSNGGLSCEVIYGEPECAVSYLKQSNKWYFLSEGVDTGSVGDWLIGRAGEDKEKINQALFLSSALQTNPQVLVYGRVFRQDPRNTKFVWYDYFPLGLVTGAVIGRDGNLLLYIYEQGKMPYVVAAENILIAKVVEGQKSGEVAKELKLMLPSPKFINISTFQLHAEK
ncbi:hypothetical protein HY045_03105 [Candidatus Woesebacteria bacterium]|nr:hypothetical protein [Candidatus Woesebacteria bacterium]